MGQEIFYCCQCQEQIRSADLAKGGALKLGDRTCCVKCAPKFLATLSPEEQEKFFKEAARLKASAVEPAARRPAVPPAPPTARLTRHGGQHRNSAAAPVLWGGLGALGLVLALAILLLNGRRDEHPAGPSVAMPEAKRNEEVPPPLRPPEGRREPEAAPAPKLSPGPDPRPTVPDRRDPPEAPPAVPKLEPPKPEAPPPPLPAVPPPPPAPAETAPAPAPAPPKRPAPPEAAKQREAEAGVRKTFNLDQAKTAKDKADLARTLLQAAATSGAKDAELYALLRLARDLATPGLDARTALEAIDARAAAFDVDAMAEKVELFSKTTAKGPEAAAWATAALEAAEEAAEADDYEPAVKLAARAEALARSAGDRGLQDQAKERSRELVEVKRMSDSLKAHFKTLESKPDDPAANAAVGKFMSLVKGDWKRGVAMLARGSDPAWKSLAESELANPVEAAAQAALGEAWAAQAERETPTYRSAARARASEWLARALPELTGLAKVSAERRLASLGPASPARNKKSLDLGGGARLELVYVKPATFTMGTTEAPKAPWQQNARPEHKVTITRGYFLGKYEVTRGQFAAFVKATGYRTDAEKEGKATGRRPEGGWGVMDGVSWLNPSSFKQTDDHPVMAVSWNDAKAFCDWATKKTGREVRLPTEAEWEFACRAGTKSRWWFGDSDAPLEEHMWTSANSRAQTQPVGQRNPNPWGLHDMNGNVWEWCQDALVPYTAADAVDPTGPGGGSARCVRGGGWGSPGVDCTPTLRHSHPPINRHVELGFRIAVP